MKHRRLFILSNFRVSAECSSAIELREERLHRRLRWGNHHYRSGKDRLWRQLLQDACHQLRPRWKRHRRCAADGRRESAESQDRRRTGNRRCSWYRIRGFSASRIQRRTRLQSAELLRLQNASGTNQRHIGELIHFSTKTRNCCFSFCSLYFKVPSFYRPTATGHRGRPAHGAFNHGGWKPIAPASPVDDKIEAPLSQTNYEDEGPI